MIEMAIACVLIAARFAIGLLPFLALRSIGLRLGFPAPELCATSTLFARMFGVRDVGLGVILLLGLHHPEWLPAAFLGNVVCDACDAASLVASIRRREPILRPALLFLVTASIGVVLGGIGFVLSGGLG